jgi:hypothetical protein
MQPWQLNHRAAQQAARHQQRMAEQAQRDVREAKKCKEVEKCRKGAKDVRERGSKT